ncbi:MULTISPECIES: outer membrane beta-barrel protein [unclassified Lentimicrobium]|uniref:outer membrane beta-barrel protein n=1 Tax=unclassified Lentimicrobium TaxID=2677434 RepID=UPI00155262F8|nr:MULTISPECIES: outer membrane beta-barrel protein [unclassified Lentimicrobium]NPD45157.1 outer membrane beta-barrel protein [Lentimicrobium sp. S6]NPD84509.1 outer membrane beta-barrel protein [Lentimicrobium sp. L6]
MKIKYSLLALFLLGIYISSNAQMKFRQDNSRNENSWFIDVNTGVTSFYGTLGVFNYDPILKIKEESKFAFGITAGKSFNKYLSARAYFTSGGFKATNNERGIRYDASLTNYGGQFLINFSSIFGDTDYIPIFSVYGIVGVGLASTKPILYSIEEEGYGTPIDSLNYATKVSTLEFNIGLGVSYEIFNQIDILVELDYHYGMSDELDLTTDGGKDNFMYLKAGLRYRFGFADTKGSSAFGRRRR